MPSWSVLQVRSVGECSIVAGPAVASEPRYELRRSSEDGADAITAGAPARRVVINGALYRKGIEDGSSDLSALCVTCPHELCPVALVTDPERLARMSVPEPKYPLFECGCHFSKFDAREDGAWVSGLAYRGLFRFRVGAVSNGTAEITEIEEEALSVV